MARARRASGSAARPPRLRGGQCSVRYMEAPCRVPRSNASAGPSSSFPRAPPPIEAYDLHGDFQHVSDRSRPLHDPPAWTRFRGRSMRCRMRRCGRRLRVLHLRRERAARGGQGRQKRARSAPEARRGWKGSPAVARRVNAACSGRAGRVKAGRLAPATPVRRRWKRGPRRISAPRLVLYWPRRMVALPIRCVGQQCTPSADPWRDCRDQASRSTRPGERCAPPPPVLRAQGVDSPYRPLKPAPASARGRGDPGAFTWSCI